MKIVIDRDACIGAASCVALAGKTFALDEEGKVYIVGQPTTTLEAPQTDEMDVREAIIDAARSCPVFAIKLYEDDGSEIIL
jgi:ferredoxin